MNKTNFHMKGFALGLALKQMRKATRKSPIRLWQVEGLNLNSNVFFSQVLETCVKNCGHRFHVLIAKKDFLDDFTRVLSLKVGPYSAYCSTVQLFPDVFAIELQ